MFIADYKIKLYEPEDVKENRDQIIPKIIQNNHIETSHFDQEIRDTIDEFQKMQTIYEEQEDVLNEMKPLRLRTWIINNLYKNHFEAPKFICGVITDKGIYYGAVGTNTVSYYSKCQTHICCPFTGIIWDEYMIDPIIKFVNSPYDISYSDLIGSCYEALEKSHSESIDYLHSAESIADEADGNDWLYDENGNRHDRINFETTSIQ